MEEKAPEQMQKMLENLPFWPHLSDKERQQLEQMTRTMVFEPGEQVPSGRDRCLGVLMIQTGLLRVYLLSEEGREVTLFRLRAGEMCMLSAACILSQITFDVLITAQEKTTALLLPAQSYQKLSEGNLYVQNFTYQLTTKRFSEVMWSMQQLLFARFDQRLAGFLVEESQRLNSLVLPLTHEEIAKQIGSAREVVTRMLRRFGEEGLVTLSRGNVTLTDPKALRRLTQD